MNYDDDVVESYMKGLLSRLETIKFYYNRLKLRDFEYVLTPHGYHPSINIGEKSMKEIMESLTNILDTIPTNNLIYLEELYRVLDLLCLTDIRNAIDRYLYKNRSGSSESLYDIIRETKKWLECVAIR